MRWVSHQFLEIRLSKKAMKQHSNVALPGTQLQKLHGSRMGRLWAWEKPCGLHQLTGTNQENTCVQLIMYWVLISIPAPNLMCNVSWEITQYCENVTHTVALELSALLFRYIAHIILHMKETRYDDNLTRCRGSLVEFHWSILAGQYLYHGTSTYYSGYSKLEKISRQVYPLVNDTYLRYPFKKTARYLLRLPNLAWKVLQESAIEVSVPWYFKTKCIQTEVT